MKFLTKDEVAKYFRVHPRTIERWLKSGELVGHKLGKGKTSIWRIPEPEITKFLDRHKSNKKT